MSRKHLIIAGGQKCGTTWLSHALALQPGFYLSKNASEIHFFDRDYESERDLGNYWSHFFKAGNTDVTVDVTPDYMYSIDARQRIIDVAQSSERQIKILLVLREPVSRLESAYHMKVRKSHKKSLKTMLIEDSLLVKKSLYSDGVRHFIHSLGRDNLLVMIHEERIQHVDGMLSFICEFCDVEYRSGNPFFGKPINSGGYRKWETVDNLLQLGGRIGRRLNLHHVVHRAKASWAYQRIVQLNTCKALLSAEDRSYLVELKKSIFEDDVQQLSELLPNHDVKRLWDYL